MFMFLVWLALIGVCLAALYEATGLYCAFLALSVIFLILDTRQDNNRGIIKADKNTRNVG